MTGGRESVHVFHSVAKLQKHLVGFESPSCVQGDLHTNVENILVANPHPLPS